MRSMVSQITSLTVVYSTVYSHADQWKHQSSASLAFVRGNHRWPVNSPHKWPVTRKMFRFNDVIMGKLQSSLIYKNHNIDVRNDTIDDVMTWKYFPALLAHFEGNRSSMQSITVWKLKVALNFAYVWSLLRCFTDVLRTVSFSRLGNVLVSETFQLRNPLG